MGVDSGPLAKPENDHSNPGGFGTRFWGAGIGSDGCNKTGGWGVPSKSRVARVAVRKRHGRHAVAVLCVHVQ